MVLMFDFQESSFPKLDSDILYYYYHMSVQSNF